MNKLCLLAAAIVAVSLASTAVAGQFFTDPGFENYAVEPGQFVRPASGPWSFTNDASVVEPFAPNSSNGVLSTWSATFAPVEGQQYASTYAGSDTIRQSVALAAAGDYQLSVFATAPDGTVTIPGVGTFTLGDGQFTFTLGNAAIGGTQVVEAGAGWGFYTADFTVASPGNYLLGVRSTLADTYFINYDSFDVRFVPEPSALALAVGGGLALALCRRGASRRRAA
jgi:hypothetical protein